MKWKIGAVLLALCMILCQIPLTAAVAEDTVSEEELMEASDSGSFEAEGPARSADGQYAINIFYNHSNGTVIALVDDVPATRANGGDLVYLAIAPASGYEFSSAGLIVNNSDWESIRTVPQADGTISFLMPDSTVNVTVLFTISEDDPPVTPTPVDEVSLFAGQPTVGETTDTEDPEVTTSDWTYEVTEAFWADSSGNAISAPLTFESDATYYIAATLKTYWEADATYFFPQADLTVSIENGALAGPPIITNVYGAASIMELIIAVEPVVRRTGEQIQVWVGSVDGNTMMAEAGGKVATSYTPSEPNIYDFGKNGEFVAGDIVQYYVGDEITVTAQADTGHRFVGWYHVNIDYNMSGGDTDYNGISPNKAYEGSAFSTASSFTYKPGTTILDGDSEPLRYVCAVFEEDAAPSHEYNEIQVWIGDIAGNEPGDGFAGGKVAVSYTPSYDETEDVVEKDGTEFSYSQIFGCYLGDEVTLHEQPEEGYGFVGWYLADGEWPKNGPEKYTGDMLSDQADYTFEFTGTNRLICAVFREETVQTCTVSFDPGTGTGSMDDVTVSVGEEYELPSCTFTHANAQRDFYKWSVDGELLDPGDVITVSGDTTVIAKWIDTGRARTIDNSVDRSTTEVVGTLSITDTRTGETTEENTFDEITSSGFTEPTNPTVEAAINEAKDATAAKAREIAEGHDVTFVSENVDGPRIIRTTDERTFTYFTQEDDAGDYVVYLIIDGELSHSWLYDVDVEAEYESGIAFTMHWSSADGVDLMDPITVEAEEGMRLDAALTAAGKPYVDLFVKDGYEDYGYRSLGPVDSYADEDEFYDDCISGDFIIEEDIDIYVVMFKKQDAAEITIGTPVCGSTDAPEVSVSTSECSIEGTPLWITDVDSHDPYEGELVGGNDYLAEVRLVLDFRYFFADDAQITVHGGESESDEMTPDDRCIIVARVSVEHDPADPVEENTVQPTCTEAGSHDDVVYCKACEEEISRTKVTDQALGHAWGDWTITKAATETEDGERIRVCGNDPKHTEKETIPKLQVVYSVSSGNGGVHTILSGKDLVFTFVRSVNESTAFSHYTGIKVDGSSVDEKNYTAVSGSVIVTLKSSYLDTLSVGDHTLTVLFDDGNDVDASFTVKKDTAPEDNKKDNEQKKDEKSPATGEHSFIGIWAAMAMIALCAITLLIAMRRRYNR